MKVLYKHYGWECSPYSSKTRSYLRYKRLPFQDIHPSIFSIKTVIEKRVGFVVMPIVVVCEDDSTLQDSSIIIDELERRHPERSVIPSSPKQRLLSHLLELFGDEWLPIISMHTRWNNPINKQFAFQEFGHRAVPFLPRFCSTVIGRKIGSKMNSYLPILGITERTAPEIDRWLHELLSQLDVHLAQHDFLLGSRPCLGDFAIYGPLYAHVWYDSGSRSLIEGYKNVNAWREKLESPEGIDGEFIADDEIPSTLYPLFQRIFHEQFPTLQETVLRIEEFAKNNSIDTRLPRGLGELDVQIGGVQEKRKVMTFQQWMLQRSLDCYQSYDADEKDSIDQFLRDVGGFDMMQTQIKYRLKRHNFRVVLDRNQA